MSKKYKHHRLKATVILFAFLLQALFPVGYMPAAFASGAPVQLCHSVFPMSFLQSLSESKDSKDSNDSGEMVDHSMHHGHHMPKSDADENDAPLQNIPDAKNQSLCAFGALDLDDALVIYSLNRIVEKQDYIHSVRLEGQLQRQRFRLFQSRAPPPIIVIS